MEQKRCPIAVGKKRQDGGENMKYVKLKVNHKDIYINDQKHHKPEQKIKASSVESSSLLTLYMHRLMILHHRMLRN